MSRERDGGREPRKEPVDRLTPDRARDGKAEEPLRFGPEREPQGDTPKGGRPDWKKHPPGRFGKPRHRQNRSAGVTASPHRSRPRRFCKMILSGPRPTRHRSRNRRSPTPPPMR